jgi:hypothetical protein
MIYYRDSKRRIIIDMLRAAPEAKNKVIANWVGVTQKYVSEVRHGYGFPALRKNGEKNVRFGQKMEVHNG